MKRYHIKEYAPNRWHVIAPSGVPVHDGMDFGLDKPLVFHDEDAALDYAKRCNENDNSGQEES